MKKFIILEKGMFEKLETFEDRMNNTHGYRPINLSRTDSGYAVLMEKVN